MNPLPIVILLAEDEPAHAAAIRRAFEASGIQTEIQVVSTLREFRLRSAERSPDIAVVDLKLPDGRAMEILTHPPEAGRFPVLMMTSYGNEQVSVEAMKAGALDYVVKSPEAFATMPRTIERALREWELLQERKQTLERLRLQDTALEAVANAIVITDRKGTIEWTNAAFTAFTGYRAKEAIGKNPGELLKSGQQDTAFYRALWETILAGRVWHSEIVNRRKDGSLYTEEMAITPLRNDSGEITHFIAIKQDITQRKTLEEQFRQAQKMEAIGRLAGGVAHDFNNILAVVLMNTSLLRVTETSSEEQTEGLDQIAMAAERGANLTRQLLAFSRRQVMKARALDLNDVVSGMIKMLQRIIGEDIALQTRLLPGVALVHGDPVMIEQVLLNLAVNARDAMPEGGELDVRLENITVDKSAAALWRPDQTGDFVRLSIRDTGSGIAPEHLPHLFEPFFTTKEVGKGTGLGLATVHGIVEQHHGWIEVESQLGKGTTFHIHLPHLAGAQPIRAEEQVAVQVRGGNETILLVEDELALRVLAVRILERYGYRVIEARSGAAALEVWRQHRGAVDLLLTDLIMPEGVSGGKLAEQLQAKKPRLKVIYMSGYSCDVAERGLNLREGVNFLQKPFDSSKLAQTVRDCLDRQEDVKREA
jgi:PAS domain S-box-containing protein